VKIKKIAEAVNSINAASAMTMPIFEMLGTRAANRLFV
jgi:hypothetical protein